MTSNKDRAIVVSALKHAAPYIRLFKGKVFVIKAGGEVFADPVQASALVEQVASCTRSASARYSSTVAAHSRRNSRPISASIPNLSTDDVSPTVIR